VVGQDVDGVVAGVKERQLMLYLSEKKQKINKKKPFATFTTTSFVLSSTISGI
jgi:hypothetical protein